MLPRLKGNSGGSRARVDDEKLHCRFATQKIQHVCSVDNSSTQRVARL